MAKIPCTMAKIEFDGKPLGETKETLNNAIAVEHVGKARRFLISSLFDDEPISTVTCEVGKIDELIAVLEEIKETFERDYS
jgi:hypothetical protein